MKAMVLESAGQPLVRCDRETPYPGPGELLIEVAACAVCRTDLHVVDGELTRPKLPLVPGHQIVGEVLASSGRFEVGARVGVPWLGWTCGDCRYCLAGAENLCDRARFTGYDLDGPSTVTVTARPDRSTLDRSAPAAPRTHTGTPLTLTSTSSGSNTAAVVPMVFASNATDLWVAVALVSLAASAHQGWSANLFTLTSDMFPRHAVGSVVGLGGFAGAVGGMLIAKITGYILETTGSYVGIFFIAAFAYLVALAVIHLLVPRLEPVKLD